MPGCCAALPNAVDVTAGGIFVLTKEHAEVEFKRSGMSGSMSLQTAADEEDELLVDSPRSSESSAKGANSPLIVGPADVRTSIAEYKAAVKQQGYVRTAP